MTDLLKQLAHEQKQCTTSGAHGLATLWGSAINRINNLEEERDAAITSYGDAWYDGFLNAKKEQELCEGDDFNSTITDLNENEIRGMSENAEEERSLKQTKAPGDGT